MSERFARTNTFTNVIIIFYLFQVDGVEFTLKFMLKQRSFSWCSALVTER